MVDFRIGADADPRSAASWFQTWASLRDESVVNFVLPSEPLHAWAIVLLGAMAADRRERGLATTTSQAGSRGPRSVFADMAATSKASSRFSTSFGHLEQLGPVRDLRVAHDMAERVAVSLSAVSPAISPSVVRMARFVFEELGANVVQHSGRPETGYGFAAVDPSHRRLELAFADAGVGFLASLQRHPEMEGRVADDAEALQLALSPGITGTLTPRTNMGIGLKLLTDFSDLLAGDLWIASGSAMLQRRTTAGQRTNRISSVPSWKGSWITLEAALG